VECARHLYSHSRHDVRSISILRSLLQDGDVFPWTNLSIMAPVATAERAPTEQNLKQEPVFNPFYSPSIADDGDASYEYARYKVILQHLPNVSPRSSPGFSRLSLMLSGNP
jgi:hypothetical protein